ncbi:MAG: glycosyltransferase family 4 protein [Pedobacter sp.]|nr:MAG: glycosyltransferase family 4 protein [Pedobacter sp.]
MKIGIISHLKHPICQPFAGGLEAFTYQITKALVAMGHQVILFASESSDVQLPLIPILSDHNYDNQSGTRKKIRDLPSEYIAEHHAYFKLMNELDGYGFDVIFNNSLHYIPITMANTLSTPILTVLHTPPFYELKLAVKAERNAPVVNYCTVSRQSAKNWAGMISDCPVILNGIQINDWSFFPRSASPAYAIWFGRIHPDKGLHHAILAARKAGLPLKVAGGIADQKYYENKIVPLLGQDISLLGLLDHNALNTEIGNASVCLVTPCWQEPFGLVVAEAMACGTPIAGFRIGALPELVTPETGYLVESGNVDELCKAIQQAQKLERQKVRDHALAKFRFGRMAEEYETLLNTISLQKKLTMPYDR